MSSRSSKLLHLDPLSIALEKRQQAEATAAAASDESQPQRLPVLSSQPTKDSQPVLSSQPTEQPRGGPVSSQPTEDSQPVLSSQPNTANRPSIGLNLLASIPEVKGTLRMPHRYTDHLCRALKPDEQAVYWQLYRLSWGWNKPNCFISNPRLSERSNVPLSSMKRAVAGLIQKGLIEKTGHTNGYGKDQGVEYSVPSLDSQPTMSSQPNMAPIKIKNTQINTHTGGSDEIQAETDRASRGVGVRSKFSIEECRSYAQHLRSSGQGINNPGGYATTIYRTGESDAMIEAFLNPAPSASALDTSTCPDCQGTGFYYPNGREQGVAKCPHSKLVG